MEWKNCNINHCGANSLICREMTYAAREQPTSEKNAVRDISATEVIVFHCGSSNDLLARYL